MQTFNQVLIDMVKAAGGSAIVGPKLFPEKLTDHAQRALLDCLNEDRPAKLSPDQVLLIFKLARAKGHHEGIAYVLSYLGYAPTTPVEPKDEMADLQRQSAATLENLQAIVARMEALQSSTRLYAPLRAAS